MTSTKMDPSMNKDGDIEVIKREHPEKFQNDHVRLHDDIDTPTLLQSLDLPTPQPGNSDLFEDLDLLKPNGDFISPNLGPLSEFVRGNDVPQSNDADHNYSAALTRYNNSLPPLPPLTEPVIPNVSYPSMPMVPDYLNNGVSSRQALIGAAKKKKDQGPKTRPAFVLKVWNMVNDPANHEYIRWTDDGQAFVVVHREEFMKLILPNYFKHNNFASFVRQLNMYGWHKVQDVTSGTMKEGSNLDEAFQFKNPDFVRGREDLLDNIVRNKSNLEDDPGMGSLQVMNTEVDKLKMTQLAMLEDLRRIRSDNQNLWQEIVNARDRERKLSQMIQKIVNFVEAAYGKSAGKIFEVQSGPHDNNAHMLAFNQSKPNYRNTLQSNNIYSPSPSPVLRPRLMLMDSAYQKTPSDTRSPASTWKDGSVEEIVRDGDDYDPSNKFLQQFMNQDPVSSPRHFFPELQNNYFGQDNNDNFLKLEQKLQSHGNDLVHTQEWIDQISKQQQQLKSPASTDTGIDDFMSEILNDPTDSTKRDESSSATPVGAQPRMQTRSDGNEESSRKRVRR